MSDGQNIEFNNVSLNPIDPQTNLSAPSVFLKSKTEHLLSVTRHLVV